MSQRDRGKIEENINDQHCFLTVYVVVLVVVHGHAGPDGGAAGQGGRDAGGAVPERPAQTLLTIYTATENGLKINSTWFSPPSRSFVV